MTLERITELRRLALRKLDIRQTSLPDAELLELLDLAELAMRTMPKTAERIEKRNRASRFTRVQKHHL